MKKLLPDEIMGVINEYNLNDMYEVRLRRNMPIVINYRGENCVLKTKSNQCIVADKQLIEFVLKRATEYSLYAYNHQIKQGFITAKGGLRLGIVGESVNSDAFMPTTIKNIASINIRIPHEVVGCSSVAFKYLYNKEFGIRSTLVISPPGAGKTTFLRDIARNLSMQDKIYNCLVVDERFELASVINGEAMLNVGKYSDVVSGATKMFAFTNAIRSMNPNVIITDELMGGEDVEACKRAVNSGVKVVASVHAFHYRDLMNKEDFNQIFKSKVFERYVILSAKRTPGEISAIFDENFNCLYF